MLLIFTVVDTAPHMCLSICRCWRIVRWYPKAYAPDEALAPELDLGRSGGSGLCGDSWVTKDEFYAGLAAAQAMPGPLFNFAAYLGPRRPWTNVSKSTA